MGCSQKRNSSDTSATIGAYCPQASLLQDCFNLSAKMRECPSTMERMELDLDREIQNCSTQPPDGPLMQTMQCHYKPVAYDTCIWVPNQSCVDSPYFPLLSSKQSHEQSTEIWS